MNSILNWIKQLELGSLLELLLITTAALLCIMVHECCHGLVALWLGDDTAKRMGRLSLNPLRHVDPIGLVMMALLRFGWAKAVPVDMRRFRHPKAGMALTSLAGPLSNILLMLAAVFGKVFVLLGQMRFDGEIWSWLVLFLDYISVLSAGLAVFNLFPVPPLDGSKILLSLLPEQLYWKLLKYEKYGMVLLALILVFGLLDGPLMTLRDMLLDCAYALAEPLFILLYSL